MIIRDTAGQHYRVNETGDAALAHVWNGLAVKKVRGGWQPKAKAKQVLVRKAGCVVVDKEVDLEVENHGSIFTLRGTSDLGTEWIGEHIPDDAQTFGGAIVVEHRFIQAIVEGAISDGLVVS